VAPDVTTVGNIKECSVIGFSSTTEFNNAGAAVLYGQTEYIPLNLARPFKENDTDESYAAQALNGQYCLPKMAKASFSIERVPYFVAHAQGGTANPTPNMARSLPVHYRIIKVGIKAVQGTQTTIDPNRDLFISTKGQPTGVDENDFSRLDCRYASINTKKYNKLMDLTGTIFQNNVITPSDFAGQLTDIVNQKSGKSLVHFTIPFKLSQRKGGKLFYESPQQSGTEPTSFTSGGQRELLLCHFWYENGHNLLGGTGQPQAPTSDDIQIKVRSMSAFVDAQ
jgi:hypothetical protein